MLVHFKGLNELSHISSESFDIFCLYSTIQVLACTNFIQCDSF